MTSPRFANSSLLFSLVIWLSNSLVKSPKTPHSGVSFLHGASHMYSGCVWRYRCPPQGCHHEIHDAWFVPRFLVCSVWQQLIVNFCDLGSEDYEAEIYSNRHEHGLEKYQLHECFNKAVSVSYYSPFCISTLTPKWLKANTFALSTHFVRKNESADTNRLAER